MKVRCEGGRMEIREPQPCPRELQLPIFRPMLSEDHVVECATHQLRRIGAFVRRYVSSIVKGDQ